MNYFSERFYNRNNISYPYVDFAYESFSQCDRIEKVIAFDLSPDSDLALVRLANCRGSDSTVGHFDIATPQEVYEYLIKDEIVRSNIAIALTGFAGDRSGCTLSVDTCNPGRRELQNRTANMICNSVAGQSGGALSIVFDQSGQIVSQSDIRESPETPNLKYKVIGIAKETHFSEAPLEDRTSADRFFVAKQFKQKSNREYANNYYEFDRSDIRKIKNAISKDYEENKAQIDANIAQMKMQGEVELAEELKQQKARSRNNY
ncbi:MAG TPA: hypothetical protein PLU50_09170 [Pseudobdellovibrionaceae bacterium]|nr:hypothetical protein [Pseudobdellovibrionaceae bacterium]